MQKQPQKLVPVTTNYISEEHNHTPPPRVLLIVFWGVRHEYHIRHDFHPHRLISPLGEDYLIVLDIGSK